MATEIKNLEDIISEYSENIVNLLYKSLLNREADSKALINRSAKLNSTNDIALLIRDLINSKEFKKINYGSNSKNLLFL